MRILVPVDGTEQSRHMLRFLAGRETMLGSHPDITLANVQYSVPEAVIRLLDLQSVKSACEAEGRQVFDKLRDEISQLRADVKETVLYGDAGEAIAAEANRIDADLIVMGTRGLNAPMGYLLGSVSNSVLSKTQRPLLLVRPETPVTGGDAMRVGVAVDGSEHGLAAVAVTLSNAELFGKNASFRILNAPPDYRDVMSQSAYMLDTIGPLLTQDEFREEAEKAYKDAVDPALELFKTARLPATGVELFGDAGEAISEYARENLDILVMGSHGRGNFTAAVMGSTAMKIAATSTVPILVVRK